MATLYRLLPSAHRLPAIPMHHPPLLLSPPTLPSGRARRWRGRAGVRAAPGGASDVPEPEARGGWGAGHAPAAALGARSREAQVRSWPSLLQSTGTHTLGPLVTQRTIWTRTTTEAGGQVPVEGAAIQRDICSPPSSP